MVCRRVVVITLLFALCPLGMAAQNLREMDNNGSLNSFDAEGRNNTFNPHRNDTTNQQKEIPRGIEAWTVDRRFGDITPAEVDTMQHLYPQSVVGMGRTGEYNTVGNNFTARLSRIFINRHIASNFIFTDAYDQVLRHPSDWHFTRTYSPITNMSYDNCGDKTNGEDHLDARFAVNAGRKTGGGFDLNYQYARGFYQNQSASHFGATFYLSHLGDQYQMHLLFNTTHQKASENGGITNDDYVVNPELFSERFNENEIPTLLNRNWNRNDNQRLFLTHRYAVGFYRKVKMSDEEIKARQFAMASKQERDSTAQEPKIAVRETTDSLSDATAVADSLEQYMKHEFVPVTSFIHTFEAGRYERIYQAYASPADLYADTYYNIGANGYPGDSIYDKYKHFGMKNTVAVALLEGFNKYVPAGLKVFAAHELRRYDMPAKNDDGTVYLGRWNENTVSVGGQLIRSLGKAINYNAQLETWVAGLDVGQLKLDGALSLRFPLFGDTVSLAASGYFYRLNPSFHQRNYHSKHLWWDKDLNMETRTRIDGTLSYDKTNTTLRLAVEEIQNYTYFGMSYDIVDEARHNYTADVRQHGGNLSVLTAQLDQKLSLGPLHWDNTITYQSSSNKDVLPLPTLNVFSNFYLYFTVARVLRVELGAAATWFTKYYAPDYCPLLNQFAVQQNPDTRVKLGNFPFVDVYANLHLKHARFFIMMNNATGTSFNRMSFLTPHHPMNNSTLRIGVSWNFFN